MWNGVTTAEGCGPPQVPPEPSVSKVFFRIEGYRHSVQLGPSLKLAAETCIQFSPFQDILLLARK